MLPANNRLEVSRRNDFFHFHPQANSVRFREPGGEDPILASPLPPLFRVNGIFSGEEHSQIARMSGYSGGEVFFFPRRPNPRSFCRGGGRGNWSLLGGASPHFWGGPKSSH